MERTYLSDRSIPPDPVESSIMRPDGIKSSSLLQLSNNITQYILLHPLIALRRTCQVNRKCSPFICVQPFSLIPFLYHQQRKQGLPALYKGLSSELLVKGITFGAESGIIRYTDWPREVDPKRFSRDSIRVMALRALSIAISTPFLCAALKETVQSVMILRDQPSFIDCLKDGFVRLIHLRLIPSARMLPIWLLVVPTVIYHVSHSAIWYASTKSLEMIRGSLSSSCSSRNNRSRIARYQTKNGRSIVDESEWQHTNELTYEVDDTTMESNSIEKDGSQISDSIIANLVADLSLLPMETVINCLYIQGTRTIVDNVDETTVVLPVLTNYSGFNDCYQSILKSEGPLGLFKGLGAITLQYSLHFLIFKVMYHILKEFQATKPSSPPRPRRPLKPVSNYKRHLEYNRHSTPTNPHQPSPLFESMLLHDSSMGGDREPPNYSLPSGRTRNLLPTIDDN